MSGPWSRVYDMIVEFEYNLARLKICKASSMLDIWFGKINQPMLDAPALEEKLNRLSKYNSSP